ncbi:hypothetical protein KY332_02535 [Candidatus Woesearchaeota archaeon]|nr:hypothetical protein [Candidatus Woesearchaeota archaeon]
MEEEVLQLGGNIELSGFSSLEGGAMIVLKKIIGNYARKMSDKVNNFEKLSITMKTVHGNQFETHAKLMDNGKPVNSSVTERNVFVAVDTALKKIMNEISR